MLRVGSGGGHLVQGGEGEAATEEMSIKRRVP